MPSNEFCALVDELKDHMHRSAAEFFTKRDLSFDIAAYRVSQSMDWDFAMREMLFYGADIWPN